MEVRERRFRDKVRRRGKHEVWTGATDASGKGLVRIDGRLRTVQRAAWEFAHGPLPPGARVLACPAERACIRLDHLALAERGPVGPRPARRPRGSGSMREVRPGVWQLSVSDGTGLDGQARRRHLTVHGDRAEATERLDDLAETNHGPHRLGDLRVRELVDRYLCWLGDDDPDTVAARAAVERVIEPTIGRQFAALIDTDAIAQALARALADGIHENDLRLALGGLNDAYRWANRRGWTRRNPADDIEVPHARRAR